MALVGALVSMAASVTVPRYGVLPDLKNLSVEERKTVFFGLLLPAVEDNNAAVLAQRATLHEVTRRFSGRPYLASYDRGLIEPIARQYRLVDWRDDPERALAELARRVDTIPVDLALVQAAKESGWGQSRSAREANNLFGEWCYQPGCGLVPAARRTGERHEVELFRDVGASVASYIDNLNSHQSYDGLRRRRAAMRASGEQVEGEHLVGWLSRYSERRGAYVAEVRGMLRSNRELIATLRAGR